MKFEKEGRNFINIPEITSLDTAIQIYYRHTEIGTKEMTQLFTKKSKSRINRLKKLAHHQMIEDNIYTYGMYKLNTKSAYKAWRIDVEDLEKRRNKLIELGL